MDKLNEFQTIYDSDSTDEDLPTRIKLTVDIEPCPTRCMSPTNSQIPQRAELQATEHTKRQENFEILRMNTAAEDTSRLKEIDANASYKTFENKIALSSTVLNETPIIPSSNNPNKIFETNSLIFTKKINKTIPKRFPCLSAIHEKGATPRRLPASTNLKRKLYDENAAPKKVTFSYSDKIRILSDQTIAPRRQDGTLNEMEVIEKKRIEKRPVQKIERVAEKRSARLPATDRKSAKKTAYNFIGLHGLVKEMNVARKKCIEQRKKNKTLKVPETDEEKMTSLLKQRRNLNQLLKYIEDDNNECTN